MIYKVNHSCSDNDEIQNFLNQIYGYQDDIPLKVLHRGRINLIFTLLQQLIKKKKIKDFGNALDIGCNSGMYSYIISNFGFKNVLGIDIEQSGIDMATKTFANEQEQNTIRFQAMNAENFNEKGKFNFILCTEVIEHTSNPLKIKKNIINLLKPNGIAVITLPNKISWPYFVEYVAYKIKRKPLSQEFKDHLNYPFYKSIKLFNAPETKIIKTTGSNAFLDPISLKLFYNTRIFGFLNKINFILSGIFPFKYFSQFFCIIIKKNKKIKLVE